MTLRLLILSLAVISATQAIAGQPPPHRQTDAQATHQSHQLIEGNLATVSVSKFLILSMDGELRVTSGEDCEVLGCGDPGEADVAIPRPIPWKKTPKDSRVLEDRS